MTVIYIILYIGIPLLLKSYWERGRKPPPHVFIFLCVCEPMEEGVRVTGPTVNIVNGGMGSHQGRQACPYHWEVVAWEGTNGCLALSAPCSSPQLLVHLRRPAHSPQALLGSRSALSWGGQAPEEARAGPGRGLGATWVGNSSILGTWSVVLKESHRLQVGTCCWPWRLLGTVVRLSLLEQSAQGRGSSGPGPGAGEDD